MNPVMLWWGGMSAVALGNMAAWFLARRALMQQPGEERALRRSHLRLSAAFVFGCAFRSFFPRADVQRIVLVDSWLSSVALGRSVATVAELCFMAQWALVLRTIARDHGASRIVLASHTVVPMIAFAECNSWYAVVTTNYLGNVSEESTWTLTATLMLACTALLRPKLSPALKQLVLPVLVFGCAYVAFMLTTDVPMYLTRWQADTAAHRAYLPFLAGLHDVATRWTRTFEPTAWYEEMPWMALYFSAAVWSSLALVWRPRLTTER